MAVSKRGTLVVLFVGGAATFGHELFAWAFNMGADALWLDKPKDMTWATFPWANAIGVLCLITAIGIAFWPGLRRLATERHADQGSSKTEQEMRATLDTLGLRIDGLASEVGLFSDRIAKLEKATGPMRPMLYSLYHLYCVHVAGLLEPRVTSLTTQIDDYLASARPPHAMNGQRRSNINNVMNVLASEFQDRGVDLTDLSAEVQAQQAIVLNDAQYLLVNDNEREFWATGEEKRAWHLEKAALETTRDRMVREVSRLQTVGRYADQGLIRLGPAIKEADSG